MSTGDMLNVFPSRANYVMVKTKLSIIERGYVLLKRKRDALEVKLRGHMRHLESLRRTSIDSVQEASFSLARVNYLGVNLANLPMWEYPSADVYLSISFVKLIGVTVPNFQIHMRDSNRSDLTGLARGGLAVIESRDKFKIALKELIEFASAEYTVKVLQESIRINNMRVNGMEYVLIPRYIRTLKYIQEEIDEFDRQDFYRLKRSQSIRIARVKHDQQQMRNKRDHPEAYNQAMEASNRDKRFSLPHWKSILTPKINVEFTTSVVLRKKKPTIIIPSTHDDLSQNAMIDYEEEIDEVETETNSPFESETEDLEDDNESVNRRSRRLNAHNDVFYFVPEVDSNEDVTNAEDGNEQTEPTNDETPLEDNNISEDRDESDNSENSRS